MSLARVFFTALVFVVCPSVWAKQCVKIDQCKCEFDDGSGTVDLSSLGFSNGTAMAKDVYHYDGFRYSYNPCYPFTEGTCVNVAACQYDPRSGAYYNLGVASSVEFSYNGYNLEATYWAPDRQSKDLCPNNTGSTTPVQTPVQNPDMTDWGSWSSWGACSVTCGTGSRMRTRSCYKPGTGIGGPGCSGNQADYRMCRVSDYCLPSFYGNLLMNCGNSSFGCETGVIRCIDIAQRCDGRANCEDDSDESSYFAGCSSSLSSTGGLTASFIVTAVALLILLLQIKWQ